MNPIPLTIHAGEGHAANGVDAAMQEAKDVPVGGVIETTISRISDATGSMGLAGPWKTVGQMTALSVICGIVIYGLVFTLPDTRKEFNTLIVDLMDRQERQQDKDRTMFKQEMQSNRDQSAANMKEFAGTIRADIRDAIKEAVRARELPE